MLLKKKTVDMKPKITVDALCHLMKRMLIQLIATTLIKPTIRLWLVYVKWRMK